MMEASTVEDGRIVTQPLLEDDVEDDHHGPTKGGLRTMPFILANESFEQMASYGLRPNMILYLTGDYHLDMASASNILFLWSAATNFTPLVGAIVADSYLGWYRTILFGCLFSILGMATLWLTTMIPESRPPPCDESSSLCGSPTTLQMLILCASFGLMRIGAGGIRSSSLAFGADQLNRGTSQESSRVLEWYFSWYYATATLSILVALILIVHLQDSMGWRVGFGIPVLLIFFSSLSFFLAFSFYVKFKSKSSLIVEMLQVALLELSPSKSSDMLVTV